MDLTGYLLETDSSFRLVRMPAIAEEDEVWKIKNRILQKDKTFVKKKERLYILNCRIYQSLWKLKIKWVSIILQVNTSKIQLQ